MNDLNRMTIPALQEWWERYVCPGCMSARREPARVCANPWHTIPAVTYACVESAFSPLSIPVAELQQAGLLGLPAVSKYGQVWTLTASRPGRPSEAGYV